MGFCMGPAWQVPVGNASPALGRRGFALYVTCMNKPKQDEPIPFPPDSEKPEPVKEPAPKPEPTRFGDWEMNGRCIDF